MRSNGLATILLLIPIIAVPALAIFGIPEITPLVQSGLGELRKGVARVGQPANQSSNDLFEDLEGFASEPEFKDDANSKRSEAASFDRRTNSNASKRKRDPSNSKWDADLQSVENPAEDNDENAKRIAGNALTSDNQSDIDPRNEKKPRQFRRQSPSTSETANADPAENDSRRNRILDLANPSGNRNAKTTTKSTRLESANAESRGESLRKQLTWDSAIEKLNEFDIRSFRLERGRDIDQFVFICSYSPTESPRVSYRFEAEADEALKAVEKVLSQITEWQKRQ